jgi:hypothetical protein
MPPRPTPGWDAIDALARAHDHVVRRVELLTLGVPDSTITRRTRPAGPWQRILPGIVALQSGPLSQDQRVRAALRYTGADAIVTGSEALRRFALRSVPATTDVHILIPDHRKVRSVGFVVVERRTRLPTPRVREQVPLAPPARAGLDVARRSGSVRETRAILAELVQRRFCTVAELGRELADGSVWGSALPRRVLAVCPATCGGPRDA